MDALLLDSLFSNSAEGIVVFNEKMELIYFNNPILKIIPDFPKEPTKEDFSSIIGFATEADKEINIDLYELDYLISVEKRLINNGGNICNVFRLKKVEKDSRQKQLAFFLGNIDEVIYTVSISEKGNKKLTYISQRVEKLIGLTENEFDLNSKLPHQYYHDADAERVERFIEETNTSKESDKCQFRIVNVKTKRKIWVELSLYPQVNDDGLHYSNFGIIRDISREIEADELLRQSELKHRLLFSEANDAIMILKGLEMVDCNEKTLSMFGAKGYVDIAGAKLYDLMPEKQPDNVDSILNYHYFMQKAKEGVSQFFYWQHTKLTGEQFDTEVSLNSFNLEGEIFLQVIVRDITLRKKAEEQKNQTIRSYFEMFNSSSDLTFIINSTGKILDVNKAVLEKYHSKKETILGQNFESLGELLITPSSEELIKLGKTWNGEPQKFEWWAKVENEPDCPLEMILHPGSYFGEEVIIASGRDISERLKFEENIRASEERFRTLASHAPIGIFLTDNKGKAIYVNDKLKEISKYPNIKGFMENWVNKIHPDDRSRIKDTINQVDNNNEEDQNEYRIAPINGDERWVKVQVNLLKSPEGDIIGKVGTVEDITSRNRADKEKLRAEVAEETTRRLQKEINERKTAESALIAAKEYTQYIINSSIDMIIATDTSGIITEFNQAASSGFGFFSTSIIGGAVNVLFSDENNQKKITKTVFEHGQWSGDIQCKRADDSEFTGYLSASLIKSSTGKTIGLMGVLRDITELKIAEKELKENVHQKEILLKEVHHRVKNNLQVISSILSLQTSYIEDSDTLTIIQECQDRIKSMAFIHESLYQAADLAYVNFAEYLRNLCTNLKYSYMSPDRNIDLDFDIEEISLSLDSSIPCGLIVNELVSNCFKYAFKEEVEGNIKISFEKDGENKKLVVHDSGGGLPSGLDFRNTDSLGLQLVVTLVDQIDGDINYEFSDGSKFIINFKRD
jgi:PAS domain S-box-containing protein